MKSRQSLALLLFAVLLNVGALAKLQPVSALAQTKASAAAKQATAQAEPAARATPNAQAGSAVSETQIAQAASAVSVTPIAQAGSAVSETPNAQAGSAVSETPNAQASDEVEFQRITVEQLMEKLAKNEAVTIIDARSDGSYAESDKQIKGAIRLTVDDIQAHIKELPRDREIVAYCTCPTEHTSGRAAQILMANGFTHVLALKGGWDAWVKAGGQVEPKKK